jgi:hypothetical protein
VFAPAFNPATLFVTSIVVITLISVLAVLRAISLRTVLLRISVAIMLIIASSIWYLLPLFTTLGEQLHLARSGQESATVSIRAFEFASKYTTLLNVLGLRGNKLIYLKHITDYYYNWAPVYINNPLMIVLTYLFPVMAYSSLLFVKRLKKRERQLLLAFALLSVMSLFLQKQGAEPFGNVNRQLLYLPYGDVFRNAYDKFAICTVFSYSLMLYFAIREIVLKLQTKVSKGLNILLILLIFLVYFIYSYPVWIGDVIYDGGKYVPSHRVIIPDEYYQFGAYMNNINRNETFVRIAVLPTTWWGEAAYKWEKGIQPNSDPLLQYFLEPKYSIIQFRRANMYGNRINERLQDLLKPYNEDFDEFVKVLAHYGVEYMVFHRDWDDNFIRYLPRTSYYESMINGYSYLASLIGKRCFLFNGTGYLKVSSNFILPKPYERFTLEIMFIPYKADSKQAIIGFGGAFWLYLTERNTIYFTLSTVNGYMWSSPIRVDFIKNSTIPIKVIVHYDTSTNNVAVLINDVLYKVRLYASGGKIVDYIRELNVTKNHIILGSDGRNKFQGAIFYARLVLSNTTVELHPETIFSGKFKNVILKRVSIAKFKCNKTMVLIEKVFENNKLVVFRIHGSRPILTVDNISNAQVLSFYRANPTLWVAKVKAYKPFKLIFIQSYDPRWKALIYKDGEFLYSVEPILTEEFINVFQINATGNLTIIIRYVPQDWFELGLKISATTFVLCVFYLVWGWRRGLGFS